jgi:uncharacterized protein YkwD
MPDLSKVTDTNCRSSLCVRLLGNASRRTWEGEGLTFIRFLRPAQRILSVVVIAAFSWVCVMSATGPSTLHTEQWSSHSVAKELTPPYQRMAQTAHPGMSRTSYERATLRNINAVRRAHHLGTLSFASCSNRVASKWSTHLALTHGFYHQSMLRLLNVCRARYAGETLGMGTMTPKKLVSLWMHSPPHRHILLSKNPQRIGIGATPNANGEWVVAAEFMRF